ncbi:hypothetical protein I4U23_022404 [Adineta vaga]|nr:hypothetical protein I4U23_022404 [Adineta vaga]
MANNTKVVTRELYVNSKSMISIRKRLPRRRSVIREFSLNTSMHGLPGIVRAQNIHNRIFWTISFICFLGIMTFFIVNAIRDYFHYPTNIDLRFESEWPQYFPAISLCNLAPLRFDKFIEFFINFTVAHNLSNITDTTTFSPNQSGFLWNFLIDRINNNESVEILSFSLASMLRVCYFNYRPCSVADFISFKSSIHGICHTFNAKMKNTTSDSSVRHSNQYGGPGILSLGLYVHSHQYVPYTMDVVGAVILIHDNTQIPLIETSGIELSPGKRYKLSYKKKRTDLLSLPYTNCTKELTLALKAMLANYDGADYVYSQQTCMTLCQQTYVYETCGCINPFLWNARTIVLPGTYKTIVAPLCNISDQCSLTSLFSLIENSSLLTQYCSDCVQGCSSIDFPTQFSSSKGLFDWQIYDIKTFVENSGVPLPVNWSTIWNEYIQQNYLSINIITESNVVEINTQTASMSFVDVISNIGGQTGLWIGISFLSVMEFIEMIYRLLRRCCSR